jgi:hypothetical protein
MDGWINQPAESDLRYLRCFSTVPPGVCIFLSRQCSKGGAGPRGGASVEARGADADADSDQPGSDATFCRIRVSFVSFVCVCPEPVLAKDLVFIR